MQAKQSAQCLALGVAEPCAAPRPGLARHQPLGLEYAYRFTNGRTAHSKGERQIAFGWQLVAVVQLPGEQLLLHVGEHHLMGLSAGRAGHKNESLIRRGP